MAAEILKLDNISKTFPGVRALNGIQFSLHSGEVHCICGENGAGKSTLIKIISGAYQPDEGGNIIYEGKPVHLDPFLAMKLGIQTIYQEHTIFGPLSITENIFAGMEITKNGIMQKAEMTKKTKEVLEYLHTNLNPDDLVENLSSGEQKIVEFAKALVFDRKVIILDEPTASFSVSEIDNLLEIVNKIKARGIGIIYISHHLDEVFKIADRITVLRDGQYIKTVDRDATDEPQLIRDMVGRDASAFYNREHFTPGETVLEVKNLTGNGVYDISFEVKRGEILGFSGMVGSGRSELMTLLVGGAEKLNGEVYIMGEKVDFKSPKDAIKHKICYITEDRQHTGLFLIHTIARNTIIANMVNTKKPTIMPKEEEKVGDEYIKKLGTKAPNAGVLAGNLSGGNQQKVVLAKWFNTNGEIFIFDEPTRGIDVGAKQEIYQIMVDLLRQGKAIIMVSSDMPEVVSMSDRVMVMKDGRQVGEVSKNEVSEENILELSIGGAKI
ncbi:sugar ABC transporter ATP-binding protein [Christensenellaceae bacterium OttesenSCG-928-K19]|nr:sugar ABC transporter ATP-binding protein [Christensenellaceae bacterium OttesenSCG-928-K19]